MHELVIIETGHIALFFGSESSADAVCDTDRAIRRQSTDKSNFVSVL